MSESSLIAPTYLSSGQAERWYNAVAKSAAFRVWKSRMKKSGRATHPVNYIVYGYDVPPDVQLSPAEVVDRLHLLNIFLFDQEDPHNVVY